MRENKKAASYTFKGELFDSILPKCLKKVKFSLAAHQGGLGLITNVFWGALAYA